MMIVDIFQDINNILMCSGVKIKSIFVQNMLIYNTSNKEVTETDGVQMLTV